MSFAAIWADFRDIDGRRLVRRCLLGGTVVLGAIVMWKRIPDPFYGFDFHGGAWPAGKDLLHGTSPYLKPDAHLLFERLNSFVTPPLLAVIAAPFSVLPFTLAISLWSAVSVGALVAALRLLGVRDWRMYVLALCSFPVLESLWTGQSDCLFALLLAIAWRYRSSRRGAVAAGVLIAAKLVMWPLLIWFVATRRYRLSAYAALVAVVLLTASWALIDFQGLIEYPRLLAADARAFEDWVYSVSVVGGLMHLGASATLATVGAVGFAFVVSAATIAAARGSDGGWFTGAVAFGLLASPVLWTHYLVLLYVPLAILQRRATGPWLLGNALWVCLLDGPFALRVGVTIATVSAMAVWATSRGQPGFHLAATARPFRRREMVAVE